VPFAPHRVVSPIGTMASAHVCAAVPNFLVLEWHWIQRLALWKSFVKEGEIIEKGWITLPDRPGLGVEMNEEAVARRRSRGRPGSSPGPETDEVAMRATRTVEKEKYERDLVRKKQHRFRDVYPLNPELRKQFEERKKAKP